jgi:Na+/melibiose symporter-like transporter
LYIKIRPARDVSGPDFREYLSEVIMFLYRNFRINLNNPHDRNAWFLILEIFWASMVVAAATFNAAFAIRLGSSNTSVGLLTSLPALLAVIISIPAGRFLKSKTNSKTWLLGALGVHRVGYVLVALLPWLPFPPELLGTLVIGLLILMTAPVHLFNVGFIPMLGNVIPAERRAAVFTARNVTFNATQALCTFGFGIWLANITFPFNYQIMYLFGFVTSILSLYFLVKVQVPDKIRMTPAPVQARKGKSATAKMKVFLQALRKYPQFLRITINTFLHGSGLWAALPLSVLYYVRVLDAKDDWLGLLGTVTSLATIGGWMLWRYVMGRWGEPVTLRRTIILLGLFPLAVGLTHSLWPILILAGINGLLVPGVNLSHINTLLKVMPPEDREEYTGIYMTGANLGIFIFPLLGVAASELFGLGPTLIGCGVLSIAGSFSFWLWPVDSTVSEAYAAPEKLTASDWEVREESE